MAGLSRSYPMRFLGIAVLCLLTAADPLRATDTAEEVWTAALTAFEAQNPKVACQQTQAWLAASPEISTLSPELHHNLAICSWMQKETDIAVLEALSSLRLQNSVPKIIAQSHFLSAMQRELGIQNSIASTNTFLLASIATPLNLLILLSLGIWPMVYRSIFLPHTPLAKTMTNISGVLLILIAAALFSTRMIQARVAVLFGQQDIVVYNFTNSETPTPLAELPRGTIVVLGRDRPGYVQILEPVPGWVQSASIKIPLS